MQKLIIRQEVDPMNPREEWDNLGTMICFHRRNYYGDKHSMDQEEALKLEASKDVITLPMYMYDHSGVSIRTTPFSCPWDSGKLGFIYVTKEAVRKEYGWKVLTKSRVEKIKSYLEGEVEVYNQYINGDIWGYNCGDDSCWGFYGDYESKEVEDACLENTCLKGEDVEIVWE